jgi:hypothetical protein
MYPKRTPDKLGEGSAVGQASTKSGALQDFSESGARGTRTPDLLGAIQALSQLSYSPERRPGPRGGA